MKYSLKDRHGILLAGGTGSRLFPITHAVNKHLLPIYNKPMIFYSLSLLMLAKIRTITIICREIDYEQFFSLFGDGSKLGIQISYTFQKRPDGIPHAIKLAKEFANEKDLMVVLGDNILIGNELTTILNYPKAQNAKILAYRVPNPSAYGVVKFDANGRPTGVVEKPNDMRIGYAVPGVYFFPNNCFAFIDDLEISERGETEVADLINLFAKDDALDVLKVGRGIAWLDTGTPSGLMDAANLVQTLELRKSYQIANLHEIALNNNWISTSELADMSANSKSEYMSYLKEIVTETYEC